MAKTSITFDIGFSNCSIEELKEWLKHIVKEQGMRVHCSIEELKEWLKQ